MNSGHYIVSGQYYSNKLSAFAAALPQGYWPHWDFFENEFSKVDWQTEPHESLISLYHRRAWQIRNDYDYIICWFSGGSDSDNMVRSFLDQGLYIDEIWHRSSLDAHQRRDSGTDAENAAMETLLAVKPRLLEYQSKYPWWRPMIRSTNIMESAIKRWREGARDPYSINYYNPLLPAKEQSMYSFNGRCVGRTAKLYGIDKPRIEIRNGKFYLVFMDNYVNTNAMQCRDPYDNSQDIWFYWHPDASDILRKQAHTLVKFIKNDPNLLRYFDRSNSKINNSMVDNIIKKAIYQNWNHEWWQQDKVSNDITHEEFYWFYKNHDDVAVQNWKQTVQSYSDEVSNIYKTMNSLHHNFTTINGINILPGCYSKWYPIT